MDKGCFKWARIVLIAILSAALLSFLSLQHSLEHPWREIDVSQTYHSQPQILIWLFQAPSTGQLLPCTIYQMQAELGYNNPLLHFLFH